MFFKGETPSLFSRFLVETDHNVTRTAHIFHDLASVFFLTRIFICSLLAENINNLAKMFIIYLLLCLYDLIV